MATATPRRKRATITSSKTANQRERFTIVASWRDSPPEFIAIYEGTRVEALAFCAGWQQAGEDAKTRELYDGTAMLLDEVVLEKKLPVVNGGVA